MSECQLLKVTVLIPENCCAPFNATLRRRGQRNRGKVNRSSMEILSEPTGASCRMISSSSASTNVHCRSVRRAVTASLRCCSSTSQRGLSGSFHRRRDPSRANKPTQAMPQFQALYENRTVRLIESCSTRVNSLVSTQKPRKADTLPNENTDDNEQLMKRHDVATHRTRTYIREIDSCSNRTGTYVNQYQNNTRRCTAKTNERYRLNNPTRISIRRKSRWQYLCFPVLER
jgi:hypothetical protein